MRKSFNIFSFIACNLTIASNKQTRKYISLAMIKREKLKSSYECSNSLQFVEI